MLAAKVANKAGMITSAKTGNLVLMTQPDGDWGARLICNGNLGITFHAMSPENPPNDWFQFVAQAASALTGDAAAVVSAAAKRCYQRAKGASDGFADLRNGTPAVVCDLDGANLELFIAKHR
jgi:hypothetical protein